MNDKIIVDKIKLNNITHCIFLADIHFGMRQNSEEWMNNHISYFHDFFIPKIKNLIDTNQDAKYGIFILGDINDNRKAIDINISNTSIDIIAELQDICPIYMITGNHDLSKKTNYGNNSLRHFSFLNNVSVISVPTEIEITMGKGIKKKKIIAIPFMGSFNEETKYLLEYKEKADYAFMHTELQKMRMDNGMSITAGVNTDAFAGKIYAGHIHKRQESKKCIYVGSPFQMNRGDIGNQKGIYVLDIKTGEHQFIPNNVSPIFQSIDIEDFLKMDLNKRQDVLNNNYNYITIPEDKLNTLRRKIDIYNLKEGTTARLVKPIILRANKDITSALDISTGSREKTIEDLLRESIDNLEIDDDIKDKVRALNKEYFTAAISIQTGKD